MLEEGLMAPDFVLMGVDGKEHWLSDYRGKTVILYFYPRDDTEGCTLEAIDFTRYHSEIRSLDAVVIGISKDSYESHCKFRDKYGLKVLILSEPESPPPPGPSPSQGGLEAGRLEV